MSRINVRRFNLQYDNESFCQIPIGDRASLRNGSWQMVNGVNTTLNMATGFRAISCFLFFLTALLCAPSIRKEILRSPEAGSLPGFLCRIAFYLLETLSCSFRFPDRLPFDMRNLTHPGMIIPEKKLRTYISADYYQIE